jgi:hypothetical protein
VAAAAAFTAAVASAAAGPEEGSVEAVSVEGRDVADSVVREASEARVVSVEVVAGIAADLAVEAVSAEGIAADLAVPVVWVVAASVGVAASVAREDSEPVERIGEVSEAQVDSEAGPAADSIATDLGPGDSAAEAPVPAASTAMASAGTALVAVGLAAQAPQAGCRATAFRRPDAAS